VVLKIWPQFQTLQWGASRTTTTVLPNIATDINVTHVSVKTSTFYHSPGTRHSPAADITRALHPLPKAAARERKRTAEAAEILTS